MSEDSRRPTNEIEQRARSAAEDASVYAEDLYRKRSKALKDMPVISLAGAAAVGFVIGALILRL